MLATIENRQLKIRNNINPKPTIAFHVILELSILIVGLFLYLIDGPSSSGIPWLGLWITLVMALVALRIIHIKILRTPKYIEFKEDDVIMQLGLGIIKTYKLDQVKALGINDGISWLPMDSKLCTIDVRTSSRNITSYELGYDTGVAGGPNGGRG